MGEEWLAGVGGVRLFARAWPAAQPVASVVIVHGVGEHSGRYERLAQELTRAGIAVFAYDHRGHGRSGGRRGHINRFDDYLDDLDRVAAWARGHGSRPLFLIGHSLGGLITLHAAARAPALADGIILSSPACGLAAHVPAWKHAVAMLANAVWPTLALRRPRVDSAYLSHDPAVGRAYLADPLVHFFITARGYAEVRARLRRAAEAAAASVQLPALVWQAGDDHLVDAGATRAMFERLASTDKQLVWLDGWYHEVFNEVERARVIAQLVEWLQRHALVTRGDK